MKSKIVIYFLGISFVILSSMFTVFLFKNYTLESKPLIGTDKQEDKQEENAETVSVELSDLYSSEFLTRENYNSENDCYERVVSNYCIKIESIIDVVENDVNYYYVTVSGEKLSSSEFAKDSHMKQLFKIIKVYQNDNNYYFERLFKSEELTFDGREKVSLEQIHADGQHAWMIESSGPLMGGGGYTANSFYLPVSNSEIKTILVVHTDYISPERNVCEEEDDESERKNRDDPSCYQHEYSESKYEIIESAKGFYSFSVTTATSLDANNRDKKEIHKSMYHYDKRKEEFVEYKLK